MKKEILEYGKRPAWEPSEAEENILTMISRMSIDCMAHNGTKNKETYIRVLKASVEILERGEKMIEKIEKIMTARTPRGFIVGVEPRKYQTGEKGTLFEGGKVLLGGLEIGRWGNDPFTTAWSLREALKEADDYLATTALEYAEEENWDSGTPTVNR